ncbi:hypothetical protein SLS53_008838 [Cytospora paraplurivora]|uniref:Uncharacterized protein n=1 Tax=Cytospora paraplurivora TaxID=2898453 RepID=A0AAN9TXC1_9PEZI
MFSSRRNLYALVAAAAVAKVNAAFGPAFSTGPTSSDTFIRESWVTLVVPALPIDNNGDLSLWVGMGTSNGDLIQSIVENYDSDTWNAYAYTLVETSATTQVAVQANGANVAEGDQVTLHYEYSDTTGNYTQTVYLNGAVISTLSTSDGKADGWGSAIECADESCGTVPAHKWINASIILDSADKAYIDTLSLGTDVEASMSSEDGITWTIGTISIPSWNFTSESVSDSASTSTTSAASSSSAVEASGSASKSASVVSSPSSTGASPPSASSAGNGGAGPDGAPGAQPSASWGRK